MVREGETHLQGIDSCTHHPTHSFMDKDKSNLTERILNLTLEIIFQLTGEDYTVVKKTFGEHETLISCPCVSVGLSRTQSPITVPPPHSLIHERNNDQKILELTNKIIQLLTGEVGLYKDRMVENHSLISLDLTEDTKISRGSQTPTSSTDCMNDDHSVVINIQTEKYSSTKDRKIINCLENVTDKLASHKKGLLPHFTSSYQVPYICTHIKEESFSCAKEKPTHSDIYTPPDITQYTSTHIKEESVLCEEGNITDPDIYSRTDHTLIKEESVSCEEKNLSDTNMFTLKDHTHYTCAHDKEESVSCEEGNLTDTDIFAPTEHAQYAPCNKHRKTDQKYQTKDKPFLCSECGKCFKWNCELVRHHRIHTGEKPYSCGECGKSFISNSELVRHQRSHTGEKKYLCSECGKYFISSTNLAIHKRIHTGKKPYSCSECGKCCNSKSDLVKHRRIHTGEKPYSCSQCGKCFICSSNLIKHQRSHTGEKPYSCSVCDKRFVSTSHLIVHQRIHTGEKPYSCSVCGKCFNDSSKLVIHQRIHS